MPYHAPAILCLGRFENKFSRPRHGMACVNEHMPSLDGLWVTCPSSVFSGYHVDIHKSH